MKRGYWIFVLFILQAPVCFAEVWTLAVEEWPPYTCSSCSEGGAVVKALKEALKSVNVDMEVAYFPRVKVLKEVQSKKYVGYLTWKESVRKEFALPSKCVFSSPLIFVEPVKRPLVWDDLKDLKGKKIGVMEGSEYFEELSSLLKRGVIIGVPYLSDDISIRLVSQGKLDAVILDLQNALYYLKQMPEEVRKEVQVSKSVKDKETFFALRIEHPEKMIQLEKALQNVDTQKIVDEYLSKIK